MAGRGTADFVLLPQPEPHSKRTEENYRFYSLKDRFNNKFRSLKEQWANRKLYHYYRCPQCRQKLRVPRGRGRIQISCPRCGTQFIKKS